MHRLAGSASAALLLIGLSACQTSGPSDITGSLGDTAESTPAPADPRRDIATYHERVRANPKDTDAALKYARALRATGQRAQAVAVSRKSGPKARRIPLWTMCRPHSRSATPPIRSSRTRLPILPGYPGKFESKGSRYRQMTWDQPLFVHVWNRLVERARHESGRQLGRWGQRKPGAGLTVQR